MDNCAYYHKVSTDNSLETNYGCLRCQLGFSGEIVAETGKLAYINQCKEINDPTMQSERDGDFEETLEYKGYTLNGHTIKWNMVPLETFLSVHKCSDDNY